MSKDNNRKPTHRAFSVRNYRDKDGQEKSFWTDIGPVWAHKDGKGFDVNLLLMPFDGRIVVRLDEPNSDKPSEQSA
jgi:hypothetical protein